jgi:hypothetical protein
MEKQGGGTFHMIVVGWIEKKIKVGNWMTFCLWLGLSRDLLVPCGEESSGWAVTPGPYS